MKRLWKFLVIGVAAAALIGAVAFVDYCALPPARYSLIYRLADDSAGAGPLPQLRVDASGNLYGLTFSGGAIFKLSPPQRSSDGIRAEPENASAAVPAWKQQVSRLDPGSVGSAPVAVSLDQADVLYGITASGGPRPADEAHDGMLFRLDLSGSGVSRPVPLYSMPAREFNDRYSDLICDAAGALYGTTTGRGADSRGTVFKLSPTENGWTMTTLYTFRGGDDGAYPEGGLVFDRAGALYGTTGGGGKDGIGTVFELTPSESGWHEAVIHTFRQPDPLDGGVLPMAGVTIDSAGTLYGTTGSRGKRGAGTIFTLTPSGSEWTYRVLYHLSGRNGEGSAPNSRLVFGAHGEVYGTTRYGGVRQDFAGSGKVYRLAPKFGWFPNWSSWEYTTIHAFEGGMDGDGSSLAGALVRTKSGALFGATTVGGGPRNNGTVFQIVP